LLENKADATPGLYGINAKLLEFVAYAANMTVNSSVFNDPIHQPIALMNAGRVAQHHF
jgi:hypothetical protein